MTVEDRILTFDRITFPYVTDGFKQWLIDVGYFTAPASIHHHGRYEGALFDHSYYVAKLLCEFTHKLDLKWRDGREDRSPVIVGLFHDLCKVDNYTIVSYDMGETEYWDYNNASILPGHGDKSVMMLQQHMDITEEEMMCIRWHMGAFEGEKVFNNYGRAVSQYPNVLWTHTADMVAARIIGV